MTTSKKASQQLEEILDPISARSLEEIIEEAHKLGEVELGGYSSPNSAEIRFRPGRTTDLSAHCVDTLYIRENNNEKSIKQNLIMALIRAKHIKQIYLDQGWVKGQP